MKNFLKVLKVSLVITIFISLMNLFIFNDGDYSLENVLTQIILSFIFSFGLTAANSYYYDGVSLRYDWEKEPKKRLWVGALGSIVITLAVFAVLRYLMFLYFKGYSVSEFIANEQKEASL